jgi:GNAT superfamily N-acetyltransferase
MEVLQAEIRLLTPADLEAAFGLSTTAGWNQRHDDWQMLMRIAPRGCFCAVVDGRVAGTAIGIDYRQFGWIAMMLVDPQYRSHGLGARLLEASMDAIPPGLPIRLDATPLGRPLYQKYGFEDETMLTRHVAEGARRGRADVSVLPQPPRAPGQSDMERIAEADRRVFGGDRRAVLQWSLDLGPAYAHVVGADEPGYCFGRRGRLFDQIGPVVAQCDAHAQALLAAALASAAGRDVAVDAYDGHPGFTGWLRSLGFTPQRPLFRMRRGPAASAEDAQRAAGPLTEYAILGPEFA